MARGRWQGGEAAAAKGKRRRGGGARLAEEQPPRNFRHRCFPHPATYLSLSPLRPPSDLPLAVATPPVLHPRRPSTAGDLAVALQPHPVAPSSSASNATRKERPPHLPPRPPRRTRSSPPGIDATLTMAASRESTGSTQMDESFFDLNDAPEDAGGGGVHEITISGSASKVGTTKNKQANFSAYEDNVLCKSWLEISCDPITNTGQRKESFWIRVVDRYNSKHGRYPKRTKKSINSRWDHIKAEVSKFSGYMAEVLRSNPSGMSDADKSVVAAADFAGVEKHNFTLMHCWKILKDEPKWMELKKKMDNPQSSGSKENANAVERDILDLDPDSSTPASSSGKRPMGRDAAKAAKKKAAAAPSEYVSKMHDLSVQKIELFKETEGERKARLDEIVTLEKVKVEEAREHRKMMLDIERERLAMDKQRFLMEAEKKEKEEDERILGINLDQCLPMQRMYYQALQEAIVEKMMSRRHSQ